jgi:Na+-transporting methylmalonyl-CoA/oxaloacetate decarboxylase gamma subunit
VRAAERGQALIETVLLGLLLLVPLMWALGVLAGIQRGALATTAAAREAGFEAARASSRSEAARAIDRAVAQAFRNQGLDPSRARVRVSLPPGLARGAAVEVEVGMDVPVLQAPFLGEVGGPSIAVVAHHVARVDPYRSRP